MAEASSKVLGSFTLRSDAQIVRYPDRYTDERGEEMWEKLQEIIDRLEQAGRC